MADSFGSEVKKLIATLNNLPKSEKSAETLTKLVAKIQASQNVLKQMGSRGMVSEVNEYIKAIDKLMQKIGSIKTPTMPELKAVHVFPDQFDKDKFRQDLYQKNLNKQLQSMPVKTKLFEKLAAERAEAETAKQYESELKKALVAHNKDMNKHVRIANEIQRQNNKIVADYQALQTATNNMYQAYLDKLNQLIVDADGKIKVADSERKKPNKHTKALDKVRDKYLSQDYAEMASKIEQEERDRARQDRIDFRNRKVSVAQAAKLGSAYGDYSFNEAASLKTVDSVKQEIAERVKLLNNLKQQEAIARTNLINAKDENELLRRKREYVEAIAKTENAKNFVSEAQQRLEQVKKETKELERQQKIHNELRKKRVDELKATRQAQSAGTNIIGGIASGSLTRKQLDFEMRRLNVELGKIPEKFRKSRADIFAKQLKEAGIHTREIAGKLELVNVRSKNIESHFAKTVRDMFSMEKLLSRISFVITAKLSYQIFDTFQRLPQRAIQAYKEFEGEITKTFALIAGSSATTKAHMERDIIGLSKTYGIEAKELSGVMYEIVSAQVPLQHVSRVLKQSIELAIAGGSDVRTAARSLVQIVNAYELGFENIARVSDIAFQTVKYGQLTMQQYTDEMQKVVSTASIFEISQEEIAGAIATMTINGIGASQAFTALNQMLMVIANPTERAKNLMQELGISLSIRDIREKGLGFALQELTPLLKMTGAAGEELITTIFKSRTGFKAVASLLQNMGEYEDNYIRMLDSAGATTEALAERTNTYEFQLNRLSTTWQAFMMSFVDGKNKNAAIGFFNSITNSIQFLSDNMGILNTIFRMFVAQLILVSSKHIVTFIAGIKAVIVNIKAVGLSLKALNANAVMLIVQAFVLLGSTVANAVSRARKLKMDEAFGLEKVAASAREANAEIDKLNVNISKMEGVKKMIEMYDTLAKKQGKSNEEITRMNNLFSNISGILKGAGISITDTGKSIESLANYIKDVDEKIAQFRQKRMFENIRIMSGESKTALSELMPKNTWERREKWNHMVPQNLIRIENQYMDTAKVISNTLSGGLADAIENKDMATIYGYGLRFEQVANDLTAQYKAYDKEFGKNKAYKKVIDNAFSVAAEIRRIGLDLQQQKWDNITMDIPKFEEEYEPSGTGAGKPSEKSFLREAESIWSNVLGGKTIYETPEQLKAALEAELTKIETDMKNLKDSQTLIDKAETDKVIASIRGMLGSDMFMQLSDEFGKAFDLLVSNAKSLREAGFADESAVELERAKNVYGAYGKYLENLSNLTPDQLAGKGLTADEQQRILNASKPVLANMILKVVQGYKDVMTDEDYIKSVMGILNIPAEVMNNYDELVRALDAAEKAGEPVKADILKKIKDGLIKGLTEQYDQIFGVVNQPEWIQAAEKLISADISSGKIKTELELAAKISELDKATIDKLGIAFTDEQIKYLSELLKKTETENEIDWLGVAGIKKYKDGNEAIVDVAGQAVSQLKNVWSFYWQWEIDKLQKQHDKKLKMLEHEKNVMLNDEYMSAEQKQIIEERFAEKQAKMKEALDKKMAAQKKKQAVYDASIDFARGLIGIWASELSKGLFGVATAPVLSGILSGVFAAQLALINNQKFAAGGYTGSGYGAPDETGHKPAGVVHAGELVFNKDMVDRNFDPLMGLFESMRRGLNFNQAISNMLAGSATAGLRRSTAGLYAAGGYVSNSKPYSQNIVIDLMGARVIDDINLAKLVDAGNKKRRYIRA